MGDSRPDKPRALVLSQDDRAIVIRRLAKALLRFQDSFLDREGSPAGLLCQVWLPELTNEGEVTLRTKGMPFCVAGLGDLLALFRCISCRFAFGTDVKKAAQLGVPGRVFTSSEPELTCNVQKYSKTAYLRKAEAEQCHVQSTLLLPVFLSAARHGCVGVLEVVQTSEDMQFTEVAELIASVMEKCDLFTSTRASIERQLPRAVAAAAGQVMLPASVDVLHPLNTTGSEDSAERANSTDGAPMADEAILEQATCGGSGGAGGGGEVGSRDLARQAGGAAPAAAAVRTAAVGRDGSGWAQAQGSDDDDDDMGEDSEGEEGEEGGGARGGRTGQTKSVGTAGTGRRRGKGTGNPGKPGVRLRLEDLQSQFGVGLKEAAARLGICPTTLKRACRRHGIQRWPRRQLAKVNQVLDQMDVQGGATLLQQHQHQQAALLQQQKQQQLGTLGGVQAADTRWTALAQFIPHLRQTVNYGDTLLAGFGSGQQHLQGIGPLPQISGVPANGTAVDSLNWGAGGAAGGGIGGAGTAARLDNLSMDPVGGSFGGALGGLTQFVELPGGANSLAQQQAQQAAKQKGLPPGVLPAPPQLWGLRATAAEGPTLSGISSLGQPPPPAAANDASAVAAQRLSALKAISAVRGANGAGGGPAGLAGGTPLPIGALNNLGGLSARSWGVPSTPHLLSASLDFDIPALAQQSKVAAGTGQGGGGGAAGGEGGDGKDDDVGFLDPAVLEMLLQEDANRGGPPMPLEQANHALGISGVLHSLRFG